MNKPGSLRAAIAAAVPDLTANPDKFLVFVDAGNVLASTASSLSFAYRYTINLILLDYAGDPDQVFVALLAWVMQNEPELLEHHDRRKDAISFEVDALNNDTFDLSIKLQLTEEVRVQQDAQGGTTATHLQEPVPDWKKAGLAG